MYNQPSLHLANVVTMTFKFMLLTSRVQKSCMFLTVEIAIHYCILNMQAIFKSGALVTSFYLVLILCECLTCVC